ncbi:glycosyltransferase family 1 protein [Planktothrix sp. FACHB-1355]|uniref:Glycosyltransferase family 1 protein n=1 Tax=Aerosakkonema funiforme FACHB-1375 TaxID=2949571 RepID=A0A926ZEM5_9CYAN|nr:MULTISPECIES: glycosyltransferase family 1 protein [Oscillatoriales]MBD2179799.1 glycosyltransferase family 1 protein [Aerosakkonema funiforme FACHB-1375]MBD3563239.1 glycosyltransferase family 1 protein [Planktothrix sp. FACHB-1355]
MTTSAQVTCITPGLPPAIDGVGDYALNVARQLRQDFSIETHFIVGNPSWAGTKEIDRFGIGQVSERSVDRLWSLLDSNSQKTATILLHYVGYGYAKRGCPFWLVNALEKWRKVNNNGSLVTMFHELYATGPIWASSFWLSPVQKNLAVRLARLSDRCLTSHQGYAQIIHELSSGKHSQIPAIPVFSNIGEPKQVPPLAHRPRSLVVFGSSSNRLRVYQRSLSNLVLTCQQLEIEEIWDVGPPTGLDLSKIDGIPVVVMGKKTAAEISAILLNSVAGFFDYHTQYLAKSGVFAAYSAHGTIPIGIFYNALQMDGLEAGKHYWLADRPTARLSLEVGQAIADNAYTWYQSHNLSVQAKTFATQLLSQNN